MKHFFATFMILSCLGATCFAQDNWQKRIYMQYYVEDKGDTTYVDELPAAIVFPRIKKSKDPDVQKYYRLVHNFSKVYPYTSVAEKVISDAETYFNSGKVSRAKKEKYVNAVQKDILNNFTGIVKKMTISQGQLLCRLVDREVGMTSYDIVKGYKSGIAAGFWQGVAKMFKQNLKTHYDPDGEDRMTEYLIEKWNEGQFPALYFSIFGTWPDEVVIPSKYK